MSDDPPIRVRWIEVVIAAISIFVVLFFLLMPVTRGRAPQAARRMQCGNNIKQLALGLQNYHDTFNCLPPGAEVRPLSGDDVVTTWGQSWIVATLPFCEQRPLHTKLVRAQADGTAYDFVSLELRQVADKAKLRYLLCPASKLPETESLAGFTLIVPSYAGIMGANDLIMGPVAQQVKETEGRIVPGPYGGWAASNGMLTINEWLTFGDCTDGTASTIIVGEVSAWYYTDAGRRENPTLAYGGVSSNSAGWLAGTNRAGTIPQDLSAILPGQIANLITLEHGVSINNKQGNRDTHPNWGTQGIGTRGLNNPPTSEHPAGAMAGFLDGHVQLLTKQTDPYVLKRLAIRDDGGMIPQDF